MEYEDGSFQYTGPRQGLHGAVRIKTGRLGYAGGYHSHPADSGLGFSAEDKGVGDRTAQPVYVRTPSGAVLRYDPTEEDPDKRVTAIRGGS